MATTRTARHTLYYDDSGDDLPDAFAVADDLDYPSDEWWRRANPPAALQPTARPPHPSPRIARLLDGGRSERRLLSSLPLPRESSAQARQRVAATRSYLQRRAVFARRRDRGAGTVIRQWRIVLHGELVAVLRPNQGPSTVIPDGRQASPWSGVAAGSRIADETIRQRYYDTARRAVALTAKHAPDWDAKLGNFTEKKGYLKSDGGIIFPSRVVLEVRRGA